MTIEQIQKHVIKNTDISKLDNEFYSFNFIDIRKIDLDCIQFGYTYQKDFEKMRSQGAFYMLLVIENGAMSDDTETLQPLDLDTMKNLISLNIDGLTEPAKYLYQQLKKYRKFSVNCDALELGLGNCLNDAIIK